MCGESTDTECRCVQLNSEGGKSLFPGTTYLRLGHKTPSSESKCSFGPVGAPHPVTIRSDIPPTLPAGSIIRSPSQTQSTKIEAADHPMPMGSFIDFAPQLSYPYPYFHGAGQLPLQQFTMPPSDRCERLIPQKYCIGMALSSGRSDCLESLFSLALPGDQPCQRAFWTPRTGPTQPLLDREPDLNQDFEHPDSPENIRDVLLGPLSLDRSLESNGLAFLLYSHAKWMSQFLFEPLRVAYLSRDYVIGTYNRGGVSRWKLDLLANNAYVITESTEYSLENTPSFFTVYSCILGILNEAASRVENSRELDREYALNAMENTYELVSSLCKVASLSCVLSVMQVVTPVFRRACPDSLVGLVNLPNLLATINIPLQYYGTLDVLLSVLTGRPMFFRYDVEFTPNTPESLFLREDGPGLRWLYGVPDRLLLTFAKMNALFEDFGSCVTGEIVDELEQEIKSVVPVVSTSTEPALTLGRVVVQQCWCLAALIYLYMASPCILG
ncbi:unnamed protein product [Rhizoctonia solani]|uniref:Uncharacterized protein n=1 Tax=Rhizoctonia solani TaxID=456999 RepID=A0A8H3AY05_9AGAM|nr:unnamed protein product [Rhizoctonia solani]